MVIYVYFQNLKIFKENLDFSTRVFFNIKIYKIVRADLSVYFLLIIYFKHGSSFISIGPKMK
jgi:hypothetical protein